jgi:hypothetical protein
MTQVCASHVSRQSSLVREGKRRPQRKRTAQSTSEAQKKVTERRPAKPAVKAVAPSKTAKPTVVTKVVPKKAEPTTPVKKVAKKAPMKRSAYAAVRKVVRKVPPKVAEESAPSRIENIENVPEQPVTEIAAHQIGEPSGDLTSERPFNERVIESK